MSDREKRMELLNKGRGIKTRKVVEEVVREVVEPVIEKPKPKKKKKTIVTETHEEINSDTLFESDKPKKKKPQELID